jgi:hypothetical protein
MLVGSIMASSPANLDQIMAPYYQIQKNLASDAFNGVPAAAARIEKISKQAAGANPLAKTSLNALSAAAAKLQATKSLKSARDAFGDLSDKVIAYLKASGSKTDPPYQFYCSMVKKNWLQPDKSTRNPYYGSSMPTCGELVQFGKAGGQAAK